MFGRQLPSISLAPLVGQPSGHRGDAPVEMPADHPGGHEAGTLCAQHDREAQHGRDPGGFLTIDVLGPFKKPAVVARLAIFDPQGETTRLLETLGVKPEAVRADASLADYDVLIIGKKALTPFEPAPDIARVRDGLKVVVFEQTQEPWRRDSASAPRSMACARSSLALPDAQYGQNIRPMRKCRCRLMLGIA